MKSPLRTRFQRMNFAVELARKIQRESLHGGTAYLAKAIEYALSAPMPKVQGMLMADAELYRIASTLPVSSSSNCDSAKPTNGIQGGTK